MIRRAIAACIIVAFASSAVFAGPDPKKTPAPKKDPKKDPPAPTPPPEPPKPFPTGADKRRIIGILDVRVDGASPEIGSQFQRDLEAQVDIKHYFLAPHARLKDILANSTKWTEGCIVGPCLKELRGQTQTDVVLLAALTGSGTSFGWVVTLVRTDSGNVLGQKFERCDVCTVSEALSAATLAVVDLLSSLPDKLPAETAAKVIAPPPVDTAPLEAKVASLEHRHTRTGLVLTIAGLAAAAAGVAYYYASSPHADAGITTAAVGGGLLLGGVVVLTF